MSSVEKKTFATEAAEIMEPNNAKVEIVNVGGNRVMKIALTLECSVEDLFQLP